MRVPATPPIFLPVQARACTDDMAAQAGESGRVKEKEEERDVMKEAEENLASVKNTLAAIDDLYKRWEDVQKRFGEALRVSLESALGVEGPCSLTEAEKHSVLGGRPSLEAICSRLKTGQYKKVIVMVGAGVSVAAGIPDFRTPGSGLYDNLEKYALPRPQAVFEMDFFRQNPQPFFSLAKELYPLNGRFTPTTTHRFISLLAKKGVLLRCYSQNIDSLERQAGLSEELLIQAHGSFTTASCTADNCTHTCKGTKIEADILSGRPAVCPSCSTGIMKPDIVFFGEDLPERFRTSFEPDFTTCDLLMVMGTSLQVQPFSSLIHRVPHTTPRLLLNRERVGTFVPGEEGGWRDVVVLGECDEGVVRMCQLCGWERELGRGGGGGKKSTAVAATTLEPRHSHAKSCDHQN